MAIEEGRDLLERLQVFRDLLPDPGPLHLDGDRAAIPQAGDVHWPSDAAARGVESNSRNAFEIRTPSSA